MKRIFSKFGSAHSGENVCAVLALCAASAIALSAQTLTTLHSFGGPDGAYPLAGLVQATNGYLYGTTEGGGANAYGVYEGTVFKMTPSGALTTLYGFSPPVGTATEGANPVAGLIQATNGDFYGITEDGGANCFNCGTVFKITPSGALTILYAFPSPYFPVAGLVQATNGYLYGTTSGGPSIVFKITPAGTLTTVYNFCSVNSPAECTDGADASAGLVQATDGNLYGTTAVGGAHGIGSELGPGTVFKITPSGTLTTLYSFDGSDGYYPVAGLVQATDGNFYGTTEYGGAYGGGTVFKITPSGTLTTLYSFCAQSGCTDGEYPVAGLVQATDGNFYGTTEYGGAYGGGTVFKITPSGTLTTLYSFCAQSGCTDGEYPVAGLVQATDGNFYGTTEYGGANSSGSGVNAGTVFKITPSGTLTTLYNFCSQSNCTDGYFPCAGLVQATNGYLYGTTYSGGANNKGTVFSLSVRLGPFAETQPTSGKVGAAVKILGTNLKGATRVTFNGTAAVFTVKSASEITTTVPTGATTGTVEVVIPGATLSSNVPFRVP